MIDSGRPLLELEQLAAWATVRLLLNEPRLTNWFVTKRFVVSENPLYGTDTTIR